MSSAGAILDAIKKINQNRALARRRRALMRNLLNQIVGNLDYKKDPNRVEMTAEAKKQLKEKIKQEIKLEQLRDWVFISIGFLLLLLILYVCLF